MRYREIVKPSARHIAADTGPRGRRRRTTNSRDENRWSVGHPKFARVANSNQSAVTSAAFITPAFAIAQGSSCPCKCSQPTFS